MKTNLKPTSKEFIEEDSDSSIEGLSESELMERYGSDIVSDEEEHKNEENPVDNSEVSLVIFKQPGQTLQDITYDDTIPENNNSNKKSLNFELYGSIEEMSDKNSPFTKHVNHSLCNYHLTFLL